MKLKKKLEQEINNNIYLKKFFLLQISNINKIINKMYLTLKNGNKILICGNGGSAADAQHLSAEFLIRLNSNVNRKPFPVLNLAQDSSTLTACGNDLGFDEIFKRNFQAFYKKGDLLFTISTSGNSSNILKVIKEANKKSIYVFSLLGNDGGKAKRISDLSIILPSKMTARVQENQIFISHFIFDHVEKKLLE
ncbi:SIS domain-containing protein [Candidatus Pelagibacter sp.]|nr:SIS domain-containing protein [Candidatus Pelagibacter sp.]